MADLLLEQIQIVEAAPIKDLNGSALTGDYVSLKDYQNCLIIFWAAAGNAADDLTVTVRQAKDATGTSVKDLAVIDRFWHKTATTNLASTGAFTKVTQTAAATVNVASAGNKARMWVAEIKSDALDTANGFAFIQANVGASANACLAGVLLIPYNGRIIRGPENNPSAIA